MEYSKLPIIKSDGTAALLTIGCGAIIIEDNKVLLTREYNEDIWKIPGGALHEGESFIECAKREAMEEVCLEIEVIGEPFVVSVITEKKTLILIHYLAEKIKSKAACGVEIEELLWADIHALPLNVHSNISQAINHFYNEES